MIYFTSDLHLGHKNVIDFCDRPFASLELMHEVLISNINKAVKPQDTLFVLGDAFMNLSGTEIKVLLSRINGKVILVQGNHDHKLSLSHGWTAILQHATIALGRTHVTLSHYPLKQTLWHRIRDGKAHKAERRPPRSGKLWHLHGHVHAKKRIDPLYPGQIDIGVDANDFRPVSADTILDIIRKNPYA